jgi:hypothetical protein
LTSAALPAGAVSRWLAAAEKVRARARLASQLAAQNRDPRVADRFEREVARDLAAARCFERAARVAFDTGELQNEIVGALVKARQ